MTSTRILSLFAALALTSPGATRAGVRVQERSKIRLEGIAGSVLNAVGAKQSGDGLVQTVTIVGDRKMTLGELSGEVIDLKEEKVYHIDPRLKTYRVQTFADIRTEREKARDTPERTAEGSSTREDAEVDLDVKKTGQKKTINGFDTEQVIITMTIRKKGKKLEEGGGLVMTSDSWIVRGMKQPAEITEFEQRYTAQLYADEWGMGVPPDASKMAATTPGLGLGFAKLHKEAAKLDGYTILSSTTVEQVKVDQAREQDDSTSQGLGGLFASKVKQAIAKREGNRSTLMTTTNEVVGITRDVTPADVAMPAAYRQE